MKDVGLDFDDMDGFSLEATAAANTGAALSGGGLVFSSSGGGGSGQHSMESLDIVSFHSLVSQQGEQASAGTDFFSVAVGGGGGGVTSAISPPQEQQQQQQLMFSNSTAVDVASPGARSNNPPPPAPQQQVLSQQLGSSYQLIQGPDGQFILQTNPVPPMESQPAAATPPSAGAGDAGGEGASEGGNPGLVAAPKSSPRSITRLRQPMDPNRTPLYEDETLPSVNFTL
jgi:hypothetical protein